MNGLLHRDTKQSPIITIHLQGRKKQYYEDRTISTCLATVPTCNYVNKTWS